MFSRFCQPLFILEFSASLSEKLIACSTSCLNRLGDSCWAYYSWPSSCLLIGFSNSMLIPSNQSSCFFTAVLSFSLNPYIRLIWRRSTFLLQYLLKFQQACRSPRPVGDPWLLILIVLVVNFILSFLILHLTRSLIVNLIITWLVLKWALLIALVFRKFRRSRYCVMM